MDQSREPEAADAESRGTDADGSVTIADLAYGLAGALTAANVLDVVADTGRRLVAACMVDILLLDPTRDVLRLVSSRHTPAAVRAVFSEFPATAPLPSTAALQTGHAVWITSPADRDLHWPALKDVVDARSFAVCPLLYESRRLGIVVFGWPHDQPHPAPELRARVEDVAQLCAAALARTQLFHRETQARARAERVVDRLRSLQLLTMRLATARTPRSIGEAVVDTAVTSLGARAAGLAVVDGDDLVVLSARGTTPLGAPGTRHQGVAGTAGAGASPRPPEETPGEAPDVLHGTLQGAVHRDLHGLLHENGPTTRRLPGWTALRLRTGERTVALAAVVRAREDAAPETEDEAALDILAAHAAVALDRLGLLLRSQSTAEALQRALLPATVPAVPGWDVGSCYVPAVEGVQVGGDWYDVFGAPAGPVTVVVGDVMGKGSDAAAVMGALRSAVRAFAVDHSDPAVVLGDVDRYLARFGGEEIATCVIATLDPGTGRLVHAGAGHPPGLVCAPDGSVTWLDGEPAPPLGVLAHADRRAAETIVPEGHVVLLYTDGLVEDRRTALGEGLERLAATAPRLCHVTDLAAGVADLVSDLTAGHTNADDVAAVALRRR